MIILKFGGTSVGSPERMRKLVELIHPEKRQIIVLSAMAGTTNQLVEIADVLKKDDKKKAAILCDELEAKYKQVIQDLFQNKALAQKAASFTATCFDTLRSFFQGVVSVKEEKIILAQGELLSTTLWHFYLEEKNIASVLLPALDFMKIDGHGEPHLESISEHLGSLLKKYPENKLFITQGFICRNPEGDIDNLKRGGSDYTASLVGAAIRAEEIQIWTDIDGMHNNDPRIVKNTKPVARLSFDEAAELAYFGAKILHPQSILPALKFNIPVRLLNTMQPDAPGTLITAEKSGDHIKALAAKDGITAIKINSTRMLLAYGFLKNIFEIFEKYRTSIDMITTSEVAVSLTIDNNLFLKEITKELSEFGKVEVDKDQTIICIVGDFLAERSGAAAKVFNSLREIPVRMISYGGSSNNISILVHQDKKVEALKALHHGLFQ